MRSSILALVAVLAVSGQCAEVKYGLRMSLDAPEASDVQVAGDFTQWEPLPMIRDAQGRWSRVFYAAPGTQHYKFKAGEEWLLDPQNPRHETDDKGVVNSAVEVREPAAAPAPIKLGTLTVAPDSFVQLEIPHSGKSWGDAKKYAGARNEKLDADKAKTDKVKIGVLFPPGFNPSKPWPILVISAPDGYSTIGHLECCFMTAAECGYVAVAADGPISRFFSAASTLDYLRAAWPTVGQWPVACAGFSGGAKVSGEMAAMLASSGWHISGVWMGGCSEDFVTSGLNLFKPNPMSFKRVPLFLCGGTDDLIAAPEHVDSVQQSLVRTGFKNIRRETYQGGHHPVPPAMVKEGLLWFLSQAQPAGRPGARPPPPLPPPSTR